MPGKKRSRPLTLEQREARVQQLETVLDQVRAEKHAANSQSERNETQMEQTGRKMHLLQTQLHQVTGEMARKSKLYIEARFSPNECRGFTFHDVHDEEKRDLRRTADDERVRVLQRSVVLVNAFIFIFIFFYFFTIIFFFFFFYYFFIFFSCFLFRPSNVQ